MSKENYYISSVIKALKVLKLFSTHKTEMTLTELSKLSGINKSSMLRIIASLESERFLKYDPLTKRYHLGIALYTLSTTGFYFLNIPKTCRPILEKAAKETGLVIHLTLIDDNEILVVDRIMPRENFELNGLVSRIGGKTPLHCTGAGKVLTAFSNEQKREELIHNCQFEKYSDKTIVSESVFREILRKVKEEGYAFNDCEHEPYLRCITRPIFNAENKCIASFSLSGIKDIMSDDRLEEINEVSKRVSKELNREFGNTD